MQEATSFKINNKNSSKKYFDVLGIKICSTPKNRLLRQVRSAISKKKKISIVTPNPEIIVKAQNDQKLANSLNSADISIPDGVGTIAAKKYSSLNNPNNLLLRAPTILFQGIIVGTSIIVNKKWLTSDTVVIKGRDLFLDLVRIANKKKWRIYLIGGEGGVAGKTAQSLSRNYKKIIFKFSNGPILDEGAVPINKEELNKEKKCISNINQFKPHLLFIGFGAPKQEKWMARWIENLDVGGIMVVGGTFNYIAAKTKLPPRYISNLGLEWLWRLLSGSQKLSRVLNAVVVFPIYVFLSRLKS